jgi:hypothetical protein
MIAESIDPAIEEYLRECLLDTDEVSDDPYKRTLCLRAALCAASLEVRASNSVGADQLLKAERALAGAMPRCSFC